jgi:hypothetical protein
VEQAARVCAMVYNKVEKPQQGYHTNLDKYQRFMMNNPRMSLRNKVLPQYDAS